MLKGWKILTVCYALRLILCAISLQKSVVSASLAENVDENAVIGSQLKLMGFTKSTNPKVNSCTYSKFSNI